MRRIPEPKGSSLVLLSLYIHIVTGRNSSPSTQQSLSVQRQGRGRGDASKINVESGRSKENDASSNPATARSDVR